MTACRMSHLPAVNYRIQRRIKKYESKREEQIFFESYTRVVDCKGSQPDKHRQIANQKHEINVKYGDGRFNETSRIGHFASMRCIMHLQGLNLILVAPYSEINPDVDHCC